MIYLSYLMVTFNIFAFSPIEPGTPPIITLILSKIINSNKIKFASSNQDYAFQHIEELKPNSLESEDFLFKKSEVELIKLNK